jgi:anti-sigma B factor antagonist
MSAPLYISQRSVAGVVILELSGRLVAELSDRFFKTQINAAVDAGSNHLVLDLKDVTYIDSGGVGALVEAYQHVLHSGGRLKLLCPSDRACRILTITHLLSIFEVFDSEEQAIRSFAVATGAERADQGAGQRATMR